MFLVYGRPFSPRAWKGVGAGSSPPQSQTLSPEGTRVSSGWRALSRKGVRVTMVAPSFCQVLPRFPRPHIRPQEGSGSLCMPEIDFFASPGEGNEGCRARCKVSQ